MRFYWSILLCLYILLAKVIAAAASIDDNNSNYTNEHNPNNDKNGLVDQLVNTITSAVENNRNDKPYVLLPITDLGIANRLRILVSGFHLARHSQRNLLVLWGPSVSCFANFDDLFDSQRISNNPDSFRFPDGSDMVVTISDIRFPSVDQVPTDKVMTPAVYQALEIALNNTGRYVQALTPPLAFYQDITNFLDQSYYLVLLWTRTTHSFPNTSCELYSESTRLFYSNLRPSVVVSDILRRPTDLINGIHQSMFAIESSEANGNESQEMTVSIDGTQQSEQTNAIHTTKSSVLIGVHIRAFDSRYDWAVVPPTTLETAMDKYMPSKQLQQNNLSSSHESIAVPSTLVEKNVSEAGNNMTEQQPPSSRRFDETSPYESFIEFIEKIIYNNPHVYVYVALASNADFVKRELVKRFGRRMVSILATDSSSREARINVQLATAEFFLLSMADFIVHAKGSSFAAQAALVYDIPVIDIFLDANGNTTHTLHEPNGPVYCGNVDYQRFNIPPIEMTIDPTIRSQRHIYAHPVCYHESEGDRAMCTLSLPMCLCGNPHMFPLLHRYKYDHMDFNQISEAIYLNNPNKTSEGYMQTYCAVKNELGGYPSNRCIGVILDSNGNSIF